MKKVILISILTILIVVIVVLVGCNNQNKNGTIIVNESSYNDLGSNQKDVKTYIDIKKGDVLSDTNFGTVTVKKVKNNYIIISLTEGFTEDVGKGINMNADDLTKAKIKKGESITVESKSFDAGIKITISYE